MAALGLNRVRKLRGRRCLSPYANRGRPRRAAPTVRSEITDTFWHGACSINRGTTRNKEVVGPCPRRQHSLSAACRCASYLPSVPSVLPPEPRTQSVMTGSPTFKGNLFLVLCSLCLVVCSLALDDQRQRTKCKVPSPSLFLIVARFQKNFFVACEVLRGEVARRGIDAKSTESPPPTSP